LELRFLKEVRRAGIIVLPPTSETPSIYAMFLLEGRKKSLAMKSESRMSFL
jgi:hypothetical protein